MEKAINDQISYEASAINVYIAIGPWCERRGYEGSAAFFFKQAIEENIHMLKFVHYLNNAEAEAIIPATEMPQDKFDSLESTFQTSIKSEQTVTKLINNLVEIAENEKRPCYILVLTMVCKRTSGGRDLVSNNSPKV